MVGIKLSCNKWTAGVSGSNRRHDNSSDIVVGKKTVKVASRFIEKGFVNIGIVWYKVQSRCSVEQCWRYFII